MLTVNTFNIYSVQYVGNRRKLTFREVNTYRCNIYRGWTVCPKTSWALRYTSKKSSSLKYSRGPFYGPQDVVPTVHEGILRLFDIKVNLEL